MVSLRNGIHFLKTSFNFLRDWVTILHDYLFDINNCYKKIPWLIFMFVEKFQTISIIFIT